MVFNAYILSPHFDTQDKQQSPALHSPLPASPTQWKEAHGILEAHLKQYSQATTPHSFNVSNQWNAPLVAPTKSKEGHWKCYQNENIIYKLSIFHCQLKTQCSETRGTSGCPCLTILEHLHPGNLTTRYWTWWTLAKCISLQTLLFYVPNR